MVAPGSEVSRRKTSSVNPVCEEAERQPLWTIITGWTDDGSSKVAILVMWNWVFWERIRWREGFEIEGRMLTLCHG